MVGHSMKNSKDVVDITKSTLPTLSSRAMFWRPKYLAESDYLEHIPFYFWLIEAQESRLILEPDLQSASSYFSMCQAMDKLNLDSRCIATIGDSCNDKELIDDYNYENYREFSFLLSETLQDVIYDIDDHSIDTLVLRHDSELVRDKSLMDRWLKKLSDQAIVLIQGSKKKQIKPLCRRLKEDYPTFEFEHGNGLLVVCYGNNQSSKILSLVSHKPNESGSRVIQNIYARLGTACRESWFNSNSKKELADLNEQLKIKNFDLNEKLNELSKTEVNISQLKNLVSELKDSNAVYKNKIGEQGTSNKELEASNSIAMLQIQQLQEELEATYTQNQDFCRELSEMKSKKTAIESEFKSEKESAETKKALLLAKIKQLQEALDEESLEKGKLKHEVDTLQQENKKMSNTIKSTESQLEYEKARYSQLHEESDSSLKIENEIAMLQVQQLQEELEYYFEKYQALAKFKGNNLNDDFSGVRLERSLQLSKMVAS